MFFRLSHFGRGQYQRGDDGIDEAGVENKVEDLKKNMYINLIFFKNFRNITKVISFFFPDFLFLFILLGYLKIEIREFSNSLMMSERNRHVAMNKYR